MSIEINGIAHIQLTVSQPEKCIPFWERFCQFLGMQNLIKGEDVIYYIGGKTGILIRGAPSDKRNETFDQNRSGLHHFCFRAKSAEDIDAIEVFLESEPDTRLIHGAQDDSQFAPGYYSILFEDPDGIRVEANYVPGKGHFGREGRLGESGQGPADQYGESGLTNKQD